MPLSNPSPDQIATARAFISNPAIHHGRLTAAEWADLHATAWAILRRARPDTAGDTAQGDQPHLCRVTIIPRALFEAGIRPARNLPPLLCNPRPSGDAA